MPIKRLLYILKLFLLGGGEYLKFVSASDIGLVRSENQDNVYVSEFDDGVFAVVCDGMGGENSGSEASSMVIETLKEKFEEFYDGDYSYETMEKILRTSVSAANSNVYSEACSNSEKFGMGTTCVAAFAAGNQVSIINVGDSRAYILCDSELLKITHDHTVVSMLISQGKITPEEAKSHPQRNMLLKAVGVEPEVEPDCFLIDVPDDFILVLCSDGLSGYCTDEEIKTVLLNSTFEESADELIKLAISKGGRDNVTVALVAK